MKLETRFKTGELTHLIERVELNVVDMMDGYMCALCDLRIVANNLREARKIAERTYGKCPSFKKEITNGS